MGSGRHVLGDGGTAGVGQRHLRLRFTLIRRRRLLLRLLVLAEAAQNGDLLAFAADRARLRVGLQEVDRLAGLFYNSNKVIRIS